MDLQPLLALMNDPWWTRIWTLQEVALAKSCFFMLGENIVSWDIFRLWFKMLQIKIMQIRREVMEFGLVDILAPLYQKIMNAIMNVDLRRREKGGFSLLYVLERVASGGRKCLDPRNRFFGIIGFVDQNCKELRDLPHISYENDQIEVYTAVAKTLYNVHSIEMLSYCGLHMSVDPDSDEHDMHFETV